MTSPFIPSSFTYGDAPQGGNVMPMIIAGRNPSNTTDSQYDAGYLWLSDKSQGGSGLLYYQAGNSGGLPSWNSIEGIAATTTSLGTVFLATLSQTESGGAPSASYVSSANDVATALSNIVVGAGVPATTLQQGYVFLATNAQAQAGLLTTNYAINPASLASVFAVPFALGSGTPAAVTATTLGFTQQRIHFLT